jgi:hypothetical protein
MPRQTRFLWFLLLVALPACDQPRAHGDFNALIVAAETDIWNAIEPTLLEALEPTIQTVANERPFRVSHQDPTTSEHWGNLLRFRQVIAVGTQDDPWVAEAIARARGAEIGTPPTLLQVQNVWARGQLVSVLVLPEGNPVQPVAQLGPELHRILDRQFREYAQNRMFLSGRDAELADSLATHVGFSLVLPQVYRYSARDSIYRFRNDNPSPTELIREIVVTWDSPLPPELPTREEIEEWRIDFTLNNYNNAQLIDTTLVTYEERDFESGRGIEYQSAWVNAPDDWPSGGPFITLAVPCPAQDRLYHVDAWLYAPGRDKYEYMIQLETILDSFRCH